MSKEKIRISFQSFSSTLINQTCENVLQVAKSCENSTNVKGPIFLPTRKRIYCVLRSPHVDKDSREQFEIRRYKQIIDIYPTSVVTTDTLLKIEVPCGVSAEIKSERNSKRLPKRKRLLKRKLKG